MGYLSGHGAALAFTTTATFLPGYTSIGGFEATRESLTTSVLSTTGSHTKIGGDLFDVGPQTHPFLIDPDLFAATGANGIDNLLFDTDGVRADQAITVTMPNAGAATLAETGHVMAFSLEDLTTDAIIAGSITTQWNQWPTIAE